MVRNEEGKVGKARSRGDFGKKFEFLLNVQMWKLLDGIKQENSMI